MVLPITVLVLSVPDSADAQTYVRFKEYSGTRAQDVKDAIAMWTNSDKGCKQRMNKEGMVTPVYGSGGIKVQYHTGMGPPEAEWCGYSTNHFIHVYERGIYSVRIDGQWWDVEVECDVVGSIAHEMGEVMGLRHGSGGIMSLPDPVEVGDDEWFQGVNEINEGNCEDLDHLGGPPEYDDRGRPIDDCRPGDWDCETPLIFDLGGDGIRTTSYLEDPVLFDLDGDGDLEEVGWTDHTAGDAFLWHDLNKNHRVDGGHEFFGNTMVLPDGSMTSNGFEALAAYDQPEWGGNDDGMISKADDIWKSLRLWIDRDHDGVTRSRETMSLARGQIVAIELQYLSLNVADSAGNIHLYAGKFLRRRGNSIVYGKVEDISFLMVEQ